MNFALYANLERFQHSSAGLDFSYQYAKMDAVKAVMLIISLSLGLKAAADVRLPSEKTFRKETREHRIRVMDFALLSIEQFKHYFPVLHSLHPEIRKRLAKDYFILHDLPKVMTKKQLERFGYSNDRSVLQRLRKVYGVDTRPEAVDDLNNTENILKAYVMEKKLAEYPPEVQALWDQIIEELKLAELGADVGDTKNFRARELGFQWERGAAFSFLASRGQIKAAHIAHWIQESEIRDPGLHMCNNLLAVKPNGPEIKISK